MIKAEDFPIIDDPLAWQERINAHPGPINMRGSARFWRTVEALGLECWYSDGVPDFTNIVFKLTDRIGLELSTEADSPYIRYQFVELADDDPPPTAARAALED